MLVALGRACTHEQDQRGLPQVKLDRWECLLLSQIDLAQEEVASGLAKVDLSQEEVASRNWSRLPQAVEVQERNQLPTHDWGGLAATSEEAKMVLKTL